MFRMSPARAMYIKRDMVGHIDWTVMAGTTRPINSHPNRRRRQLRRFPLRLPNITGAR